METERNYVIYVISMLGSAKEIIMKSSFMAIQMTLQNLPGTLNCDFTRAHMRTRVRAHTHRAKNFFEFALFYFCIYSLHETVLFFPTMT